MNRKQKKAKRLRATRHKEKCLWLKGGMPRRYKKLRGLFITKSIRISRRRLHEISIRTMNECIHGAGGQRKVTAH